eukprot:8270742-Alexandrium_andersonii.AAC.1
MKSTFIVAGAWLCAQREAIAVKLQSLRSYSRACGVKLGACTFVEARLAPCPPRPPPSLSAFPLFFSQGYT